MPVVRFARLVPGTENAATVVFASVGTGWVFDPVDDRIREAELQLDGEALPEHTRVEFLNWAY